MIGAGIDAGSRALKVLLFDAERSQVLACGLADQSVEQERLAAELLAKLLEDSGLNRSQVSAVVATGYGRNAIRFADTTITEITCHARGVYSLAPDARTIIEIGGQDSKVISLEDGGTVRDFAMNDRCAAGTGRFLEMVASRLDVSWEKLAELARQSQRPALISNMCVVFAETEILGLLAEGKPLPDVVAGVQNAIATRVSALAGRLVAPPVYFTGGVALQAGMARALAEVFSQEVRVAPQPQFTGALGAALCAINGATWLNSGPAPGAHSGLS
ncbi:MAG TPA: acyl-CoA dehydratase activase [Dongiaceae bacterium]|nr:ATPase, activator of (R)-hydroxyglutaryl-CoA dehydratase [Verrucomicrobiota bacterium]HXP61299.1 acyl-CoA dehydratase activase [Dongiaceae bacterium]